MKGNPREPIKKQRNYLRSNECGRKMVDTNHINQQMTKDTRNTSQIGQ